MGTSIRATLIAQMNTFTPSERKVARALLDRYPSLGLGPIATFAKQADVSDPTVFRFVVRIGFASYTLFQQALHDEIEAAMNTPLSRMSAFHSAGHRDEGSAAIFAHLTESLDTMVAGLDTTAFDAAVSLLADPALRIFCGGGRYTSSLAEMLHYTLSYVRADVHHVDLNLKAPSLALADMSAGDVLVVFDFRRYQSDSIRFAKAASERQVRIVLITDEWVSPIGECADVVLRVHGRPFSVVLTAVPALALAEALMISVTNRDPERARQRMERIEAMIGRGDAEPEGHSELLD